MKKQWAEMTPEEKREERFRRWLSPAGVKFNNAAAEKAYKERVTRFIKTIKLEEPDRVPVILPAGTFPVYNAGMTLKEAMYDNQRVCQAYRDFFKEFEADTFTGPGMVPSGRSNEIIDNLTTKFPGRGLPDDASMQNFVEGEYMKAEEYDHFIDDMSDFCLRCYLPRTIGALAPFAKFSPLPHILGLPHRFLAPAVMPEVRAAFQAIIDYGKEAVEWGAPMMEFHREALAAGYPAFMGGMAAAPFDILADTLRGTHGIVMDMYRRPEKVHAAMEKLVPVMIDSGVEASDASGGLMVFMALHKGDDTFMSDAQYETFYWPTFRKVILGIIEAGMVPYLFAEGKYTNRLKTIKDLPKGKVIWYFDRTDMFQAKEVLGDRACIAGNVPTSLLRTGTAKAVKEYCRQLIEVCGKGGGFILTGGASLDKGKAENLKAMTEAAFEYGVYKKK
jgi:uroporphyrinogen-III decarboxylase